VLFKGNAPALVDNHYSRLKFYDGSPDVTTSIYPDSTGWDENDPEWVGVPEPNPYWCDRYIMCVKGSVEDDKPPAPPLFRIDEIKLIPNPGYWQTIQLKVTYELPKDILNLKVRMVHDLAEFSNPHISKEYAHIDLIQLDKNPNTAIYQIAVESSFKTVFFRMEEAD